MPKVFLVAKTSLMSGFMDFLKDLGHDEWTEQNVTGAELLCETAGRLCYKSWAPYKEGDNELNGNVTKVRTGNKPYLGNVLNSRHGSVFEHVNFTFIIRGCSRVLTHELVRHRSGMAYSQESLRYCKLDSLEIVLPDNALPDGVNDVDAESTMIDAEKTVRNTVKKLNKLLLKDDMPFSDKKKITSYIRRIAPIGVKTNIMFTANARALRHVIEQRTNIHAEEEIREVFHEVAKLVKEATPNIFQDMDILERTVTFDNSKV